jgi:hypothetical protein
MPKRSSKPRDLNSMAAAIVEQVKSDEPSRTRTRGRTLRP